MKDKLAIFDLDGTLFDTGRVNFYAYEAALRLYGYGMKEGYYKEFCEGRNYRAFLPSIVSDPELIELIHKDKIKLYTSYLQYSRLNDHLFSLIQLINTEYHIAIVTTASKKNCDDILTYFHKESLFDYIVSQEDVVNIKPDPEGFFNAMNFFHVSSAQTLIFEDSDIGIQAGLDSGAKVLKVEKF